MSMPNGHAGTLEIRELAIDEACYLIEGEVTITDLGGNCQTFRTVEGLSGAELGTCHIQSENTKRCTRN
jgi:uncharacterized cupin superfamily protein